MFLWVFQLVVVAGCSAAGQTAAESSDSPRDALMADRLERMDKRLQRLETENQRLQDSVQGLTNENQRLQDSVQAENSELKESLSSVVSDNQELRDTVSVLVSDNQELRDTVSLLVSDNDRLRETVFTIETKSQKLRSEYRAEISHLKALTIKMNTKSARQKDRNLVTKKTAPGQKQVLLKESFGASDDIFDHGLSARADDAGPLELVVAQMGQRLNEVSAEVETLKNSYASDIQALDNSLHTDIQTLQNSHHTDIQALNSSHNADIQALKADNSRQDAVNSQQDLAIQEAGRSTYVRWGHSACPGSATIVYSGVVGGSYYSETGGASNYLCLSMSPALSDRSHPSSYSYLYGAEYETEDTHQDKNPVCAVCRSQHSTTIMVPGTNVCMPAWTREYSGYLMMGRISHAAASEFICVDSAMESRISSNADEGGKRLYFTVTYCGSLPCDPYVHSKIVTCAVCSK